MNDLPLFSPDELVPISVLINGGAGKVIYTEPNGALELRYAPGDQPTVYVPSSADWARIMPTWAHDYRETILQRIIRTFEPQVCRLVEASYDQT